MSVGDLFCVVRFYHARDACDGSFNVFLECTLLDPAANGLRVVCPISKGLFSFKKDTIV